MNLWEFIKQGAVDGWNPNNPIGINPETRQKLRDEGFYRKESEFRPLGLLNEALIETVAPAADLATKSAGGAYGAATGLLAAAVGAAGTHRPEALHRDLMAMPEAFAGTALGGAGRTAVQSKSAAKQASVMAQPIVQKAKDAYTAAQLERLIWFGGPPVRVRKLTDGQLEALQRVLPPEAYQAFVDSDRVVRAEKGLLDSLRDTRGKHAERLIRRMPELTRDGDISGNHQRTSAARPIFSLPSPHRPRTFDAMVLDALDNPGRIGVPSIHTMRENTLKKGKKP